MSNLKNTRKLVKTGVNIWSLVLNIAQMAVTNEIIVLCLFKYFLFIKQSLIIIFFELIASFTHILHLQSDS